MIIYESCKRKYTYSINIGLKKHTYSIKTHLKKSTYSSHWVLLDAFVWPSIEQLSTNSLGRMMFSTSMASVKSGAISSSRNPAKHNLYGDEEGKVSVLFQFRNPFGGISSVVHNHYDLTVRS